jgi:phosphoribosylformylglycinamidine synthase
MVSPGFRGGGGGGQPSRKAGLRKAGTPDLEKVLADPVDFPQHPPVFFWWLGLCSDMKAKIIITPKKAVVDPQGKTVKSALEHLGYQGVAAVHVGKYLEVDLAEGVDPDAARKALDDACHRFLSNPVIEDYRLEIG